MIISKIDASINAKSLKSPIGKKAWLTIHRSPKVQASTQGLEEAVIGATTSREGRLPLPF